MITCNECGKVNGEGHIGTNWICSDCKITPDKKKTSDNKDDSSK